MNWLQELNTDFRKSANDLRKGAMLAAKAPVIYSQEEQEAFIKGLKSLAPKIAAKGKDFFTLTRKDFGGYKDDDGNVVEPSSKTTGLNRSEFFAMKTMFVSLDEFYDSFATINKQLPPHDRLAREDKALHIEQQNRPGNDLIVSNMADLQDQSYLDTSFLPVFQVANAIGRENVKVSDLVAETHFEELRDDEDPRLVSIGSTAGNDSFGPNRYGRGVRLNNYDSQFSPLSANDILTMLRVGSLRTFLWACAKETLLVEDGVKTFELQDSGRTTTDSYLKAIYDAIYTLNNAYYKLILDAAQHSGDAQSGYPQSAIEARLLVTIQTPVIFYYNPIDQRLINDIIRIGGGQILGGDNLGEQIFYPIQFAPSLWVPPSGGMVYDDMNKKDQWGTYGTTTDYGSAGSFGGMMVIPGLRNIAARFQNLTFGTDIKNANESRVITGFERYKHKCDLRQKMWVGLKSHQDKLKS